MRRGRGGRNWRRPAGEAVLPDEIEEIEDEAFENSAMAILYGPGGTVPDGPGIEIYLIARKNGD